MTRKQQQRKSAILSELSKLSRKGWQHARPEDYQILEKELASLRLKEINPQ